MLRILLVDDEAFIRQGLRLLIDWKSQGFEIVEEASNGLEAIDFLRKNEVELIIADIKMPEMDGLELIEYIRREKISHAHFAILSGFYDFSYAQTAIRYRCTDYILKPVQKEELITLLQKTRLEYDKKKLTDIADKEKERALFEQHMLSLIWGKYDQLNLQYIREHMKLSERIRYINIETDFEEIQVTQKVKRQAQRALYEKCLQILGPLENHIVFDVTKHESGCDVGFIWCDYMASEKNMTEREYLCWFVDRIGEEINYPIRVYAGNEVEAIEAISESYRTANVARSFYTFRDDKDIAFYEKELELSTDFFVEKQKLDNLVAVIEANQKEQIIEGVDILYEEINYKQMDVQMIGLHVNYFLYQLMHLAMECDDNINQEQILKHISAAAFHWDAVWGSSSQFKKFALEYAEYLAQLRQNTAKGILQYIEKEIAENYQEDISLKTLSEKYYINSAYLGQIFKKQFGQGFKEYLNTYRLERASEFLLRTNEKVYAIAKMAGYHNLDYFINRFVAYRGCTPTQYRKQSMAADTEQE